MLAYDCFVCLCVHVSVYLCDERKINHEKSLSSGISLQWDSDSGMSVFVCGGKF